MALMHGQPLSDDGWGFAGLAVLPFGALHWYAAKGAERQVLWTIPFAGHRNHLAARLPNRNRAWDLRVETDWKQVA